jgi:NADH:ubiquinone oxidoreductase subunit B-like Fe-S oxidoreductase
MISQDATQYYQLTSTKVTKYRCESSCTAEQSPLQWVERSHSLFSIQANLACCYLAIPATSANVKMYLHKWKHNR